MEANNDFLYNENFDKVCKLKNDIKNLIVIKF